MVKRIAVVTGTRAEFGLLRPLLAKIEADLETELQLVVTGMHLSPEFGTTVSEIASAGYPIADRVEMLLSSDTAVGTVKSIGLGMIGLADSLHRLHPDWLVLLGDRFEVLAAAVAGVILGIPIAHFHGGERTDGLIDEPIRHSVTKMASVHFVSAPEYRKRVIQLGEHPDSVFHVGAIGLDRIETSELMTKSDIAQELDVPADAKWCVVTFHPVTLQPASVRNDVQALVGAMAQFPDMFFLITKANADASGRLINTVLGDYCSGAPNARLFDSLGSHRYLSVVAASALVLGNSSSGIIEAPHLGTPTIDIGARQGGRARASSVVHCEPEEQDIVDAILFVLRSRDTFDFSDSPYFIGGAAKRAMDVLKTRKLDRLKTFYDVEFD